MESILLSIKKLLGLTLNYDNFDEDLIIHINSVFSTLNQLGVGPPNGFSISDKNSTWDEFLGDDSRLECVKSYMYLKVRLLFDPPQSSYAVQSMKEMINEYEWRLNATSDS